MRKEIRHFHLPGCEAVFGLKVPEPAAPMSSAAAPACQAPVLLQLMPEFTHLLQRRANLIN
jgi:hypothetical protein